MSRQQPSVSISAQTIDSLWSHRIIRDTIEYQAVELFTAFLDLLTYGLTKNSPYIAAVSPAATRAPGYLAMVASQGRCARLVLPVPGGSGQTWTAGYTYSDNTQVSSAWSDMTASGNLEYYFEPGLDANGELAIFLRLGYIALGRPLTDSGLILTYPGNALDYGYTVTGSQSSNFIVGTAPPNGTQVNWESAWPHGADLADLAEYPLMESTATWQGSVVTSQAQIDAWTDGQVQMVTAGMTTPAVNVGGGAYPSVKDVHLGDAAHLAFTSQMHPAGPGGQPGLMQEVRVTGITWYPSGASQSDYGQLTTSAVPAAI
jgi:hypothetical protein